MSLYVRRLMFVALSIGSLSCVCLGSTPLVPSVYQARNSKQVTTLKVGPKTLTCTFSSDKKGISHYSIAVPATASIADEALHSQQGSTLDWQAVATWREGARRIEVQICTNGLIQYSVNANNTISFSIDPVYPPLAGFNIQLEKKVGHDWMRCIYFIGLKRPELPLDIMPAEIFLSSVQSESSARFGTNHESPMFPQPTLEALKGRLFSIGIGSKIISYRYKSWMEGNSAKDDVVIYLPPKATLTREGLKQDFSQLKGIPIWREIANWGQEFLVQVFVRVDIASKLHFTGHQVEFQFNGIVFDGPPSSFRVEMMGGDKTSYIRQTSYIPYDLRGHCIGPSSTLVVPRFPSRDESRQKGAVNP